MLFAIEKFFLIPSSGIEKGIAVQAVTTHYCRRWKVSCRQSPINIASWYYLLSRRGYPFNNHALAVEGNIISEFLIIVVDWNFDDENHKMFVAFFWIVPALS